MYKRRAGVIIILLLFALLQFSVFAAVSDTILLQAPNLVIKTSVQLEELHFDAATVALINSSNYVVITRQTFVHASNGKTYEDDWAFVSSTPFKLNAPVTNAEAGTKYLPLTNIGSYKRTFVEWNVTDSLPNGNVNLQDRSAGDIEESVVYENTSTAPKVVNYIFCRGSITNNTGLNLTYQVVEAPSQYDGFVNIQIPTEGSTVTNADTLVEVFSDQQYLKMKVTNTTDNEVTFETDSYVQPSLFNRQGPNQQTGQYGFYIKFKDLPVLNNKSYVIEVYGCTLESQQLVQSTEKAFRNFSFDNTHDMFIAIKGIVKDNIYENNVKFSVQRSLFYINTPMYIKLNGQTVWTMGTGITETNQINLFNEQADYRKIGANTLSVVRQSDGEVFTSTTFYLKTPYNETTGTNEDDFSDNPSDGSVLGGTNGWDIDQSNLDSNGAPQLPANANIIDYGIYAFKMIIYGFAMLGSIIKNLTSTAASVFVAVGGVFSFLPQPLPGLITAFCAAALVISLLKLIFKR